MAKNIVRKSLSILSASVLGASVLVAAPAANAAGELKLEPSAGTLYAVPHKTDFQLKVSVTPGNSSNELQFLKFKVATAGGVSIAAAVSNSSTSASASTTVLVAAGETDDVIDTSLTGGTDVAGYIALYATDSADAEFAVTASNVSATVTAFIDKDGDDVVDSGEWQAAQTVTWIDSDLLTPTFTLVQPVLGDTALVARLTSTQINVAQSHDRFVVDFSGPSSYTDDDEDTVYSAVLDRATFTSDASLTVVAGTYSANLELNESSDVDIATVSRTVSSTTVNTVAAAALAGADNAALASNASSANIRSGSGSLVYTVTVTNSSSVGIKDAVVTLTVAETAMNNVESAATISVKGTTLKNADATDTEDISVTGTTDADGEVSFTISWSALGAVSAGDPFSLEATIDGRTGGVDTFTTVAAAATTLYSADVQANDEQVVVPVGQSFNLTYHLVDQFGQLFKTAGYSVTATAASAATATGVFNNGIATVTFAGYNDANKGAKAVTTAITNTLGVDSSTVTDTAAEFTVFVGAPTAATTIELAGTYGTSASKSALNTSKTADADVRGGTATTAPSNEITDVTATVRDTNGNGTRSKVTFSGANLIFKSATGIYKKGSITVWTDSSGVADVDVSSQYAGTQVMTVTAGGATKTQNIVFADAAATTGTKWTFTVPASVAAGSTFKVLGTLTDFFGNPVRVTDTADVAVSYDGPGLVSGSLPNTTNASGQFSFWVLVGSNDRGTATITASYDRSSDGDFTGTTTGDLDVVTSTTITLGAGAVGAAKVNVGSFNGKLVVYANGYNGKKISWKVGGKWGTAVATSDTARFARVTPRKGVTVSVQIFVDGVLTLTKSVVTK